MPEKPSKINSKYMPVPKDYDAHFQRIQNTHNCVDSTSPPMILSSYMRPTLLRRDYEQLITTTKHNLALLARICIIKRTYATNYGKVGTCGTIHDSIPSKIKYLKNIEKQNAILADRILNVRCEVVSCKKLMKSWKNTLKYLKYMCTFPVVLPDLLESNSLKLNGIYKNYRPLVYLDLGITNGRPLGRIIIILYLDLAPITVKNFIDLCENHRIHESNKYEINKECQLIKTRFHRIFTNLFIYGGNLNYNKNIQNFNGIPDYEPEKFQFHHGYKGTLSMCPMANGLINSEFTISLKPLQVLNGHRLAFGRVIKGLSILDTVANFGTKNGKPKAKVEITNCGLMK